MKEEKLAREKYRKVRQELVNNLKPKQKDEKATLLWKKFNSLKKEMVEKEFEMMKKLAM